MCNQGLSQDNRGKCICYKVQQASTALSAAILFFFFLFFPFFIVIFFLIFHFLLSNRVCLSLITDNRYLLPNLKSLGREFSFFSRENN